MVHCGWVVAQFVDIYELTQIHIFPEPTKIVRGPYNVIVIKGSLAKFDCKIQSDPTLEVKVTWLKDNKFLIFGRR